MQAVAETLFDAIYLITVITIGTTMIVRNNGNKQYRLFGIMAVVLGAGDAHYHDSFLCYFILCMACQVQN